MIREYATRDYEESEPPGFAVSGKRRSTGEPFREVFTCLPAAPAGVLDDLGSAYYVDDNGNQMINRLSVLRFFRGILVDADTKRFVDLCRDKDRIVDIELLANIMQDMSEELTGRPTTASSGSSPVGQSGATNGTAGSSPAVPPSGVFPHATS